MGNVVSVKNPKTKPSFARHAVLTTIAVFLILGGTATFLFFTYRIERLKCFCIECGDLVIAERSFFVWDNAPREVRYRIVTIAPTIFSKAFDGKAPCQAGDVFGYDWSNPGVGVAENRFLIIEGYQKNTLGNMRRHFTAFGIDYYFDCPGIGCPLADASADGLRFQQFLLTKKESDPNAISALQESLAISRANPVWKALLTEFAASNATSGG